MYTKVLIANRGEIAIRVARACHELGIEVVWVHSSADRDSAMRYHADHMVQIGPPAARDSYLYAPAILEAALRTGAQAVHPGYGFLSEDPDFAEVCGRNGIKLIGPPPAVTARLADKSAARATMADAGLPLLPGSVRPLDDAPSALRTADEIGYPVIIKAVAGGGGRGMRVVRSREEFAHDYRETRSTAQALFGDGRVYVERYLPSARHVEVQVFADAHGNAVHLGERDCSVQRRHQKLIEEAPATGVPPELVERMCRAAVDGALAVGYEGAGTFEFLVDPAGAFYFMEVNCRIQVEHPVTEVVTGLDLVQEQLRVAAGYPLSIKQADVVLRGVAIECRINVEDPDRNFAPTPGTLHEFVPAGGPFVRVETHGYQGYQVPPWYDSLLAKLIVWAPDRAGAIARMRRALSEFRIAGPGVSTTAEFLREVVDHPSFRRADHDTSLIEHVLAERRARSRTERSDAG